MNLSTEQKLMELENKLVVAEGEGMGGIRSLGLSDTTENRFTRRSC